MHKIRPVHPAGACKNVFSAVSQRTAFRSGAVFVLLCLPYGKTAAVHIGCVPPPLSTLCGETAPATFSETARKRPPKKPVRRKEVSPSGATAIRHETDGAPHAATPHPHLFPSCSDGGQAGIPGGHAGHRADRTHSPQTPGHLPRAGKNQVPAPWGQTGLPPESSEPRPDASVRNHW